MRTIRYILIMCALYFSTQYVRAQYAYFPESGVIHYDKTVHVKNLLKRHVNALKEGDFQRRFIEDMIPKVPETAVLKKKMSFNGNEMHLEPVKETLDPIITNLLNAGLLDYQSTVHQNFKNGESNSHFDLAGTPILVRDSLISVKWKITNEYREIAGYACRRANGVVLDSVYVVAFYTDQIPMPGGPGTIHGLPGMILGFVVPEQHFNIYATEVNLSSPVIKSSIGGKRDTPMTRAVMKEKITASLGQWITGPQLNLLIAAMLL